MMKKKWNYPVLVMMLAMLSGGLTACGRRTQTQEMKADAEAASVQRDTAEMAAKEHTAASAAKEHTAASADGSLTVTFLDVGEGNAVLVENDGSYMLIDGGDRDDASFVVSYLKDAGVEKLDYVIASHYDADHLNGVVGALHVFDCDTLLAADYTADTRVYDSFCEVVTERDIALAYPKMGERYQFGDAVFTIVCPDSYAYAEANDNSIGIRLEYNDTSFLICGDAGSDVEEMMLQSGVTLDSDVYLASHHGSDYSSSSEFLQAVSPTAVIISVGADNSYGHPSERVLADAEDVGAEVYRTDELGTITVTSDGSTIAVEPSEPKDTVTEPKGTATEMKDTAAETKHTDTTAEASVQEAVQESADYVMNRNTKKFHLPSCSSADDISIENRADFSGNRQELIDAGYEPCKRCNP